MAVTSEVVVYGVPVGQTRPVRLGTGTLPLSRLVLADPPLAADLASSRPPWVLRVGIGSVTDGNLIVEVIEVLQVLQSVETHGETLWALELTEAAQSPVDFGRSSPPAQPAGSLTLDLPDLVDLLRRSRPQPPSFPLGHRPTPPAPAPQNPPVVVPAGLWCLLFPRASFCR